MDSFPRYGVYDLFAVYEKPDKTEEHNVWIIPYGEERVAV